LGIPAFLCEGGREGGSVVVVVVGVVRGQKEDLGVKSDDLIGCCNMLAFCETE